MNDPHVAASAVDPPRLSARRAPRSRPAPTAAARTGRSPPIPDRVRRLEISARRARAQPEARRRLALRHHRCARRISTCTSPGTINNLGSQGCMFDNLIRRDPRDSGKTIIPDLAHSWEIAKDGKTYTFFLRKGVQFHDGAELTADDVKATFDRIAKPPAGHQHPAQHPVQGGQRDHRAATNTRSSSSCPSRARPASSCRRSPAAGTSSCARRHWRTTTTICARSDLSPAPARSAASDASRTKSG